MKPFIADIITGLIGDIKAFLAYPKKALVKPEDWSDLDEDEQKDWKSDRLTFALSLAAMTVALIVLVVSMFRSL